MKNIRYSPDATDGNGSGTESTANGSSSASDANDASALGAADATASTTESTQPTAAKAERKPAQVIQERLAKEKAATARKIRSTLEEFGVELSDDDDPFEAIKILGERSKAPEQTLTDLEKFRKAASINEEKARATEARHQNYVQSSEMRMAVGKLAPTLVPEAIPDLQNAFLATHKIRETSDGVKVYNQAGQILLTDDGEEMTPEQALEQFVAGKSFYLRASTKSAQATGNATTTTGNMRGSGAAPGTLSMAELSKLSPEDMLKALRAGTTITP
jgi:hypothetical protein